MPFCTAVIISSSGWCASELYGNRTRLDERPTAVGRAGEAASQRRHHHVRARLSRPQQPGRRLADQHHGTLPRPGWTRSDDQLHMNNQQDLKLIQDRLDALLVRVSVLEGFTDTNALLRLAGKLTAINLIQQAYQRDMDVRMKEIDSLIAKTKAECNQLVIDTVELMKKRLLSNAL